MKSEATKYGRRYSLPVSTIVCVWKHTWREGFSCAEIDTTLAKYCNKTYLDKFEHYKEICGSDNEDKARSLAENETLDELENSLQGLEFQLNTRESSRGDYPSK